MSHWNEPAVVIAQFLTLIRLVHFLGGIYIWEFLSNLDYEYSVITGKCKFIWSFPLYLGCRWCPLGVVVIQFLFFDSHDRVNCEALNIAAYIFGYLSFAFASALVILRVVAIWDRNKIVVTLVAVSWLATIGSYIYCVATSVAVWNGLFATCQAKHIKRARISFFITLVSDLVLFLLMLGGLRWRHSQQKYGMWRFLYMQGLVWVLLVTLAEVPPAVFMILDLNEPLNLMFQTPALIIMAIGASRLYRGLVDAFGHPSIETPADCEWSTDLRSVPRVLSHKVSLTTETHTGGLVVAPNNRPTTFDSEMAKIKDADTV